MNKFFKLSMVCLVLVLSLGNVVPVQASESVGELNKGKGKEKVRVIENKSEILKYAKENNLQSPEKINRIRFIETESEDLQNNAKKLEENYITYSSALEVRQSGSPVKMTGTVAVREFDEDGPVHLQELVKFTVRSEYDSSITISKSIINAGLGVNLSKVYEYSQTRTWDIPRGQRWVISFYPTWTRYYFDVLSFGNEVGYGRADIALNHAVRIVEYNK